MKAAIYCRVSTEDQEREGSSLDSQLGACLKVAVDQGWEVPSQYIVKETWSGLTLDRPDLTQLRNWAKEREINAVVAYSTDRLSRDPVHLLLLVEEFEKAGATLHFVTEPLDNSMEGQLLSFVRGWASKLETVKIRERTMRGKMSRALSGRLPSGGHARLYGYIYVPGKGDGEGIRIVNEEEAAWVREMFRWLVEEGLSTIAITDRLRSLNVPTPSGKGYWVKSTVQKMLRNTAYCGKTYAFTVTYGEPKKRLKPNTKYAKTGVVRKPKDEWVEIPGATPAIISEELFETAQRQLKRNREASLRHANPDNNYLLRGHIQCRRCGRGFWAFPGIKTRRGKRYFYPFYICSGNQKQVSPVKCGSPRISASRIEPIVWEQVERLLATPELVVEQIRIRQEEKEDFDRLQVEMERIDVQLANRDKQKARAWKAFEITGDEETFRQNIQRLEADIEELRQEKRQLEQRMKAGSQFSASLDDIEKACAVIRQNAKNLSFKNKRVVLEALQLKAWVDGHDIAIEGAIPLAVGQIENPQSGWHPPVLRQES